MSELSFLLDLFLNYKLPKNVKDAIKTRIRDIEDNKTPQYVQRSMRAPTAQAPSTQAILDQMAAQGEPLPIPDQIAQTPAAAAALAARAEAIRIAVSGVEEKGRRSPRKF